MAGVAGLRGVLPAAVVLALCASARAQVGPDVIVGDLQNCISNGGGSYAIGTTSCNIGTAELTWNSGTNFHPVISQNIYRKMTVNGADRFEQIGQAWLKHGFCALQGTVCSNACQPSALGCGALGVQCSDPYDASLNNSVSQAKSLVNASTGIFPVSGTGSGPAIRLHGASGDFVAGASYFVSSMYVQPEDAAAHNNNNNESYRPCTIVDGGGTMTLTGTTQRTKPGIQAWKDSDPSVTLTNIDVSGDGRFIVASKATSLGGGQYHYEYAVQNLNSDRSGQAFTIPVPAGATVSNAGFHGVLYTSEPYSSADWSLPANQLYPVAGNLVWAAQTFAQNANANALRWDTIYNFRFDCNIAPGAGGATITLFKPGSPSQVSGLAIVPGGGPVPPPQNDACASALIIGAGATSFDTTSATTDGPTETTCNASGSNQITNDIWFSYTAAVGGSTVVSTCGSAFDTRVAVYGATCPGAPDTAIACNDDNATACGAGSLQSQLTFTATQNATYLIRVGGFNGATGAGTLTVSPPGPVPPPNDDCGSAITVAYPSSTAFSTANSTTDASAPAACGGLGSDIWFQCTPNVSGNVTVSLCGANYDSVLAIYTGGCPGTTQVACNDDSCGLQSQITFASSPGTTYLIRIGGYNGSVGSGTLAISGATGGLSNDFCANATTVAYPSSTPFNTAGSTTDGVAPTTCGTGDQIGNDIWYRLTPCVSGTVTVSLCDATFDSVVAVYTGACPGTLIACNDDSCNLQSNLTFSATAGTTYLIRVGGYGGATGSGTLAITGPPCAVPPPNDNCNNRAGIGIGTTAINTANATTDGPATGCGQIGQDIWYNHPATTTGQLTITMCGNPSTFDSMLAVYANAGCTNLASRLITCNNDGPGAACTGGRSQIKLNIVSGRNYTLRVGGAGAATGTGSLTLSVVAHCRSDWDANGIINPGDIAAFVNDWFASLGAGTMLGDFDNDGVVGPTDIANYVNQWFSDLGGVCS